MRFAPFVLLTAVLAAATGCAGPVDSPRRIVSTSAGSTGSTRAPSASSQEPTRAALAWAAAYCGWTYVRPYGARERAARALMTAAAASDLALTPTSTWRTDVVAAKQVATCTNDAAHVLEGPQTSTTVYLLITADRIVVDRTGSVARSQFIEPRRLVFTQGRWLVDARVEGG